MRLPEVQLTSNFHTKQQSHSKTSTGSCTSMRGLQSKWVPRLLGTPWMGIEEPWLKEDTHKMWSRCVTSIMRMTQQGTRVGGRVACKKCALKWKVKRVAPGNPCGWKTWALAIKMCCRTALRWQQWWGNKKWAEQSCKFRPDSDSGKCQLPTHRPCQCLIESKGRDCTSGHDRNWVRGQAAL